MGRTIAGGGDIDALDLWLRFPKHDVAAITNVQSIWRYFLEHSEPSAAKRVTQDPSFRPDSRQITIQVNEDGTKGFSLTVDQLLTNRTFWLPDLGVFAGRR